MSGHKLTKLVIALFAAFALLVLDSFFINAMTVLIVVRLLQWEVSAEANGTVGAAFSFLLVVVLGNVLAWLVTRAIPYRRPM